MEKPDVLSDKVNFGLSVHEAAWKQARIEVVREIFEGFRTKFLGYLSHPAGHGREGFTCPKWCQHCEFEHFESKYLKEEE